MSNSKPLKLNILITEAKAKIHKKIMSKSKPLILNILIEEAKKEKKRRKRKR